METHFPALVIVVPLITALIIAAVGRINDRYCLPLAIAALATSLGAAMGLLMMVLSRHVVAYRLGGWPPPWGIAYRVDFLNSLVLIVVGAVALINLFASSKIVREEFDEKVGAFYSLYLLFVTGLLGIVVTGDAFNLYVLLEIASLTGYALIGLGPDRAPLAGLNYVFMGTIGASLYLLGIGYLYLVTGSLNMADIAALLPALIESKVVLLAFILCMTGLFVKMAFFPLHGWLPNAYSQAPAISSSLIAPLTTKVMIYVMIRVCLYVFTPAFFLDYLNVNGAIVWVAVGAIVFGSLSALGQKQIRRMLAYVVIAEVGYMVGGFWIGNRIAMTGAVLHIINDAMMTLCVFLGAAALIYKQKNDALDTLNGAFQKMPVTMAAFIVGGLSIIGVPPTCGFFSKWYLISGAITARQYAFVAALLFSSLINAVLFFRVIEHAYFQSGDMHGGHGHLYHGGRNALAEAPLSVLIPLVVVAFSLIILGIFSGTLVNEVIRFAIPASIG